MKEYIKKKLRLITLLVSLILVLPMSYAFTLELVETDPSPIVAGDYADLTFRFTNNANDGELNDVKVDVLETDMIKPLQGHDILVRKIFSGESVTRTVRIFFSEELEQGFIDVPFTTTYNDVVELQPTVRVFIQDANSNPDLQIGDVESTPNELLADTDNNKLKVTIQNLGDKDAELVRAELIVDQTKIKPSHSFSFIDSESSIKSGEEGNFEFDVDVEELVNGEVPAKLNLRYRSEEGSDSTYKTRETTLDLNIPIADAPYLVVENVELLNDFAIGTSENIVRVTLKNEGSEDAKEVRVRVTPDVSYPFSYEMTTEYVSSEIKVGESAQVEFKIEVLSNAEIREYPTTVLLESLVSETRYTREDSITIKTTGTPKRSGTEIATMIIAVVLVVSAALGYYSWNNRKAKKGNKK